METTSLQKIMIALESSPDYKACPTSIQTLIRGLVVNLYEKDWDNWDANIEMDFVENLLLSTLRLPA